jgi:hypothetical protein
MRSEFSADSANTAQGNDGGNQGGWGLPMSLAYVKPLDDK